MTIGPAPFDGAGELQAATAMPVYDSAGADGWKSVDPASGGTW